MISRQTGNLLPSRILTNPESLSYQPIYVFLIRQYSIYRVCARTSLSNYSFSCWLVFFVSDSGLLNKDLFVVTGD